VLFVLRTRRPAFRSRPGQTLSLSSLLAPRGRGHADDPLPAVPGRAARPQPLPGQVLVALVLIVVGYIVTTELVEPRFLRAVGHADARHERRTVRQRRGGGAATP
jgi:P-type Mg2+ transporter